MGGKRKPNAVKEQEGTLRSNMHKPEVATTAKIEMPDWLTDERAWECWHKLVPMLDEIGVLAGTDVWIVARFCQCVADYRQAMEEIAEHGATVVSANGGLRNHPAWARKKDAATEMHKCGVSLGLSPSDRASLGDLGVGKPKKDDFESWQESA